MAIQSLEQFRSTFSSVDVEVEIPKVVKFSSALKKELDGADSEKRKEIIDMFGAEVIGVFERIAREGNKVYLRPLTSIERDRFEASVVGVDGKRNLENLRGRLVASCWKFQDGTAAGDAAKVGKFPAQVISMLFDKVRELNGMDAEESVDEAGKG